MTFAVLLCASGDVLYLPAILCRFVQIEVEESDFFVRGGSVQDAAKSAKPKVLLQRSCVCSCCHSCQVILENIYPILGCIIRFRSGFQTMYGLVYVLCHDLNISKT